MNKQREQDAQQQAGHQQPCQHRIADARNQVVKSGYLCVDCGALFSAADHFDQAQQPGSCLDGVVLDEDAAFEDWFNAEQGKPYEYMWDFAKAAWNARAAQAAQQQAGHHQPVAIDANSYAFQAARGVMGTENQLQDNTLRRAIEAYLSHTAPPRAQLLRAAELVRDECVEQCNVYSRYYGSRCASEIGNVDLAAIVDAALPQTEVSDFELLAEFDCDKSPQPEPVNQQMLVALSELVALADNGVCDDWRPEWDNARAAIAAAEAAQAQRPADGVPAYPPYDCFSDDDGDYWMDCPEEAAANSGLAVGDEFELLAGWRADRVMYRVTKAPDDDSDDYEVEMVPPQAALAAHKAQEGS